MFCLVGKMRVFVVFVVVTSLYLTDAMPLNGKTAIIVNKAPFCKEK